MIKKRREFLMKKFLSLLLAAMMIISVLPTAAFADGMKTLDMAPVGEVAAPAEEPAEQPTEEPAAEAEQPAAEPAVQTADERPIITKMAIFTKPDLDSNTSFYGSPEGTLFQLDGNNERTGKTGMASDCFNYAIYVKKGTTGIKAPGRSAVIIKKVFSYEPEQDASNKAYTASL